MGRQSPPGRSVGPRPHACTRTRACTAPTNACRLIISTSRVSIWACIYTRALLPTHHGGNGQPRSSSVRGDDPTRPELSLSAAASVRLVAYCLRGAATLWILSFRAKTHSRCCRLLVSRAACGNNNNDSSPPGHAKLRPSRSFSREEVDGYVRESVCPAPRARANNAQVKGQVGVCLLVD
jgi:hypothetical protein